jgi:hypothetical protein
MSRLRDQEAKKRQLQEENDILLAIGKEGKEGDKLFKEHQKLSDKESEVKRNIILEELEVTKRNRGYNKFLADLLKDRLRTVAFPEGWTHMEAGSDRGVVMELKSPDGRIFRSAFASVKDPLYDLNAIDNFALRAENTIEKVNKLNHNGIWTAS